MTTEYPGQMSHHDRIVQDPQIMVGKPVVKGTRIPVERVIAHLADNPDMDDLFAAFPHLTIDDVKACLAYARDKMEDERKHAQGRPPEETRPAHV
jgi:uncharacterized protein (DUF433 family)